MAAKGRKKPLSGSLAGKRPLKLPSVKLADNTNKKITRVVFKDRNGDEIDIASLNFNYVKIHNNTHIKAERLISSYISLNSRHLETLLKPIITEIQSHEKIADVLSDYVSVMIFKDDVLAEKYKPLIRSRLAALARELKGQSNRKYDISDLVIPQEAPRIFDDTVSITPSEFLLEVWGPYVEARILFQHTLRKLDPALMKGLDNEFGKDRAALIRLVPPQDEETDRLLMQVGVSPDSPARGQLATALRKAGVRVQPI